MKTYIIKTSQTVYGKLVETPDGFDLIHSNRCFRDGFNTLENAKRFLARRLSDFELIDTAEQETDFEAECRQSVASTRIQTKYPRV